MAGVLDKLEERILKRTDERMRPLASKMDEMIKVLKKIEEKMDEMIKVLKKIEENTRK